MDTMALGKPKYVAAYLLSGKERAPIDTWYPSSATEILHNSRLIEGARDLFGEESIRRFGLPEPISAKRVHSLADEEIIDLGNSLPLRNV